MNLETYINEIE